MKPSVVYISRYKTCLSCVITFHGIFLHNIWHENIIMASLISVTVKEATSYMAITKTLVPTKLQADKVGVKRGVTSCSYGRRLRSLYTWQVISLIVTYLFVEATMLICYSDLTFDSIPVNEVTLELLLVLIMHQGHSKSLANMWQMQFVKFICIWGLTHPTSHLSWTTLVVHNSSDVNHVVILHKFFS